MQSSRPRRQGAKRNRRTGRQPSPTQTLGGFFFFFFLGWSSMSPVHVEPLHNMISRWTTQAQSCVCVCMLCRRACVNVCGKACVTAVNPAMRRNASTCRGGLQLCWMENTQSWCRCSRPASPGEGGGAWPFLNVHYARGKKAAIVFVQFKKKRASEHDCSGAGADSLLSSSRHWVCRCLHLCMHPFVYAHQWGEGDLCSFDVSTDPRDKK